MYAPSAVLQFDIGYFTKKFYYLIIMLFVQNFRILGWSMLVRAWRGRVTARFLLYLRCMAQRATEQNDWQSVTDMILVKVDIKKGA